MTERLGTACEGRRGTLDKALAADARELARTRKTESVLRRAEAAKRTRDEAQAELDRRAEEATQKETRRFMRSFRGIGPAHTRVKPGPHPAAAALRSVARLGHPELKGASLKAMNLSIDEGAELASLVKRMSALADEGGQLSLKERARYEFLVGQAAGSADRFAERRADATTRKKLSELKSEARKASLPLRPKFEKPGAVVLPARVFELLMTSRDASWTLADCGMLVAVFGMFANHDPGLILGAHFEQGPDGEDVLVTPEDLVIRPDSNPHPMQGGAGQVKVGVALATLARHRWIRAERRDGTFRIRLEELAN